MRYNKDSKVETYLVSSVNKSKWGYYSEPRAWCLSKNEAKIIGPIS